MHILRYTRTPLYFWVKCVVNKIAVDGETARDGYSAENVIGEITFIKKVFFQVDKRTWPHHHASKEDGTGLVICLEMTRTGV